MNKILDFCLKRQVKKTGLLGCLLFFTIFVGVPTIFAYELADYKWPQPSAEFYVDIPGADGLWNEAFESAMYEWSAATVFDYYIFRGVYSDPCDRTDNRNGTGFSETFCGDAWGGTTLATAVTWLVGAEITETDIVFNANESWNVYEGPLRPLANDFQRVAVHELGHALGLEHEDSGIPSIMASYIGDISTPQQDDIDGVAALYGDGCTYSLSSAEGSFSPDGGNETVSVTASQADCEWHALENLAWVSLSTVSGTGNGIVTITVSPNTGAARSGSVTIAGLTYLVHQAAVREKMTAVLTRTSPDLTIPAGTDARLYGTVAPNQITIEKGAWVELINFPGNNDIFIGSDFVNFSVSRSGTVVIFEGSEGTIVRIPATSAVQSIYFAGIKKELVIENNRVMLDDQPY